MGKTDQDLIKAKLKEIKKTFPRGHTALLPALHLIQEHYGYLTDEGLSLIEEAIGISRDRAKSVASFYQFFRFTPPGKVHVQICTNLPCLMRGAMDLLKHVSEKYQVKPGEVSEDGKVSLEEVECIGLCDGAPAALINQKRYLQLDPEKIEKAIEDSSNEGSSPTPTHY